VDIDDALATLLAGVERVIPEDGLREKLALGRPLRVKFGVDPSRPDLHLGHAVPLRKLRAFQDLGHVAVLIIGDYTGRVGDPSGQSETRPMLTSEEMDVNARTYLEQAGRVIDMAAAEVLHNSEWLASMSMDDLLRLTASATVAQMLERDDFQQRHREGRAISVVELLYPLLQGTDSVAVRADVELGGTDQTFNLLMGRSVQRDHGQEPQVVITTPLLEGTDGRRKMSKSFGNTIGLTDPPDVMFGRLMRVPDELVAKYLRLCTGIAPAEANRVEVALADGSLHPAEQKRRLAREVVDLYHGAGAGAKEEERFDELHREERIDAEDVSGRLVSGAVWERPGSLLVASLLLELGLVATKSEGRRAIEQAGVRVWWPGGNDRGERVTEDPLVVEAGGELLGSVWSVGKRQSRMARVDGYR
jgi:tyrosyl-tRNA synthetase